MVSFCKIQFGRVKRVREHKPAYPQGDLGWARLPLRTQPQGNRIWRGLNTWGLAFSTLGPLEMPRATQTKDQYYIVLPPWQWRIELPRRGVSIFYSPTGKLGNRSLSNRKFPTTQILRQNRWNVIFWSESGEIHNEVKGCLQ